ncbi:DUF4856 domain-containing protein [Rhodocytophaga rosea]|uniref:DUF4856 domain-containing protein n=1 Tax=Rhodocytophaga rosea TaxID=2704465 RepID=A0A6C0GBV9_9BACT|nr:DUF4856 domain-containing protein [Rhodocytophaga rosea]QHT65435.1 DUF4856 domain-containing protein [Rhodocytophaga rosea]
MLKPILSRTAIALFVGLVSFTACDKDDSEPIQPYDVPATYDFEGADYSSSTHRINMAVELNSYLGSGTSTILSQATANNLFNNTNTPFANAALNTAGVNLADKTADVNVFKGFIEQRVTHSNTNNTPATDGTAGYIPRGSGKILVGPQGLENNQAVAKGMMGSLFFKEAMAILAGIPNEDNATKTEGATAMESRWDEAFGYLGIPEDYDTTKTYANTDPNRPLLWGGYLTERGKPIQAGGILFEAFRKGRAAIGAKDYAVRDQQVKLIQETWEKLAAISALAYVTIPQASTSVGNLGTQFHALSEGYGFVLALKYRPAGSKLSEADYQKLVSILTTNFYTLVNEPGFTKLKEAENILKTTYSL